MELVLLKMMPVFEKWGFPFKTVECNWWFLPN